MSYKNTFIKVSPDCPVTSSVVPQPKTSNKPIHVIQYELLSRHPYRYTFEQLLFEVHIRHKNIPAEELEMHRQQIWDELFSKSHACLRASQLPKKYGFGVHHDAEGRIAIYGMETPEYERFVQPSAGITVLNGMRSHRDKQRN
ncbi:DUF6157 family protein [Paenibacillus fonticola]|uniref:DUF6157 family protein n=1 Tax=Paenibacillus fonticola TaxID=379896 RepID=UPI000365071E|nr:DUF6157 family protein [Paenibacillus fonticola]